MSITGTTGYYLAQNNRIKVQFEDIAGGANAPAGWVYQTAKTGNNPGFQGTGYYYWKDELALGIERTTDQGLVTMKIYIEETGTYSLRVRSARDSNDPGDARNDIWVKVDASTDAVVPDSFAPLHTKNGFTKLYKAQTTWGFAERFGTKLETDPKPLAALELEKGFHTITFAGRSMGLHVDYVELFQGTKPAVNAPNTVFIEGNTPPGGTVTPPPPDAQTVSIKAGYDDWEQYGGAGDIDLELGYSGTRPGYVGLRFSGLDIPAGAEIESAYLEFRADDASTGAADFIIALQNSTNVARYSSASNPAARSYLGQTVAWSVETWQEGQTHRSVDVSALIQQLIGSNGLDISGALGFRITGTGKRSADAFEASGGTAPKLVIKLKATDTGDTGTAAGTGTPTPGTSSATIRASADDWEERGFGTSHDLELGLNGSNPQYVGLRFGGLDVPDGADITSAYFQFEAFRTTTGAASFTIAIENTQTAAGYTTANTPGMRTYLAETVAWSGVETWQDGQTYRSADISSLIEAVIETGGLDALDTLAFRITGTGARAAHAFDSDGAAPMLVINYEDLV